MRGGVVSQLVLGKGRERVEEWQGTRMLLCFLPPASHTHKRSPMPPPWIDASLWAGAVLLRWKKDPNTPRVPGCGLRLSVWLPEAGLMFFWSRCSSVTVLVSLR